MSTLAEDLMRAPKLRARPSADYFRQRLRELRAMRKRPAESPPNRRGCENDRSPSPPARWHGQSHQDDI